MDITKRLNGQNIFLFLFLIIFPFGQIIRIGIIQPIDVVVGLAALYSILYKLEKPKIFKTFKNTFFVFLFTFVFSIFMFWDKNLYLGLLYLFRLISYFYFLIYIWNFAKTKKNKELLINSLFLISISSAIFGWIQFFTIPDLRAFFTWGWDEHLFRLVGTFLDPTFLGLIIVFGLLVTMHQYIIQGKKSYYGIAMFLLISLAFTYSRASYLAFLAGASYLFSIKKKIGYILYPIIILSFLIFMLPTSRNPTIEVFRKFSAVARIENYKETIEVFKSSPLFGVGYNNMCLARQKFIGIESFSSHACSGSDSSLLFVLATTGIIGFSSFIYLLVIVWRQSNDIFKILGVSVIIHSLFSNSLFYPWVMGYLIIIFTVNLGRETQN
ncbi:MAG TPA: O-antigen ligase family protein [Patescibacteria group bacterium]|nr:O-antigen ligase family protein [Patescibacteria group bacterium]